MILVLLCLFLIGLLFLLLAFYHIKQSNSPGESSWAFAESRRIIRAPPPCLAANPVATPCGAGDSFPSAALYLAKPASNIEVAVVSRDSQKRVYAVGSHKRTVDKGL